MDVSCADFQRSGVRGLSAAYDRILQNPLRQESNRQVDFERDWVVKMIISKKKFEKALAEARNEILRQNDLDYNFREIHNRIDGTNRRLCDLEMRVDKLFEQINPKEKKRSERGDLVCR